MDGVRTKQAKWSGGRDLNPHLTPNPMGTKRGKKSIG